MVVKRRLCVSMAATHPLQMIPNKTYPISKTHMYTLMALKVICTLQALLYVTYKYLEKSQRLLIIVLNT